MKGKISSNIINTPCCTILLNLFFCHSSQKRFIQEYEKDTPAFCLCLALAPAYRSHQHVSSQELGDQTPVQVATAATAQADLPKGKWWGVS